MLEYGPHTLGRSMDSPLMVSLQLLICVLYTYFIRMWWCIIDENFFYIKILIWMRWSVKENPEQVVEGLTILGVPREGGWAYGG